jgi:membrane-associated phospholipid phosphatase
MIYTASFVKAISFLRNSKIFCILILLFSALNAESKPVEPDSTARKMIISRSVSLVSSDVQNILRWKPHFSKHLIVHSAETAGAVFVTMTLDESIRKYVRRNYNKRFDSFIDLFEPFGNNLNIDIACFSGYAGGLLFNNKRFADASFTAFEGLLITESGISIVKYTAGRSRPFMDEGSHNFKPFHNRYDSFPSGHTAAAFTTASVLSEYYPKHRMIFYSMAACTGLQRIYGDVHWASDVLTGGIAGFCIGKLIAHKHILFYPYIKDSNLMTCNVSFTFCFNSNIKN